MIELLRFILITIHVLAGAAWFGAMLYSLLALHPRALLFFQNSKQFEDFIAFLAAGARWKVLGIMALIAFSGMALLFLPGAQQSVLFRNCVIIKIILFIFALVVFCYASWILWPARIMAVSHEISMFQRRFRIVAIVLICLIGLSMVLGLTSVVEPVSSAVQTNAVDAVLATTNFDNEAHSLTNVTIKVPLNALSTNLADWTNTIPEIKLWSYFQSRSSWVAVPMNASNDAKLLLTGKNGSNQFIATLTDVEAKRNYVRRLELHSTFMNIDDTRQLGDSLLNMMGLDRSDFDAWCYLVGDKWVGAPLYESASARIPNTNKFYEMQTLKGSVLEL